MDVERGFWQERDREGSDAELVLAAHLHELRELPYERLRERAGRTQTEHVAGLSGTRLRRRTAITLAPRGGREELHVHVRVDDDRVRSRLAPAEERVTATPDGEFVREWTLAAEGADPRRYAGMSARVQAALIALVLLALVLWVVLSAGA